MGRDNAFNDGTDLTTSAVMKNNSPISSPGLLFLGGGLPVTGLGKRGAEGPREGHDSLAPGLGGSPRNHGARRCSSSSTKETQSHDVSPAEAVQATCCSGNRTEELSLRSTTQQF